MRDLKVAVWQTESRRGEPEANLERLRATLRDPRVAGSELLVAPEMVLTGFGPDARAYATPEVGGLLDKVGAIVAEAGVALATSVLVHRSGRDYNTFYLWGPDGKIWGKQDKMHLWAEEAARATPGASTRPIQTPWGKVGGMVCYDVEFPELARTLAVAGAELFIVPSAFYSPTSWDIMTRARALENGCFLVAANQFGGPGEHPHDGTSRVVDPFGNVVAEVAAHQDGIATATLDARLIAKARAWAPFLRDRRLGVAAPDTSFIWSSPR